MSPQNWPKDEEPASEILANALQALRADWSPGTGITGRELIASIELAYRRSVAQEAEGRRLREQIDAALSVDGVTPDDAPLIVDAYSPANAWVEGYQAGQESVFAELPNDPDKNAQGGAALSGSSET